MLKLSLLIIYFAELSNRVYCHRIMVTEL